jgi:hypothetical protein
MFAAISLPVPISDTSAFMSWIQSAATVIALAASMRALKRDSTKDNTMAVLSDETFLKKHATAIQEAKDAAVVAARTEVADRIQVLINSKYFMSRELQDAKNSEFSRRLQAVEEKIDNVPAKTAQEVMLRIRHRDFNSEE